jgi:hypothetical protein
MRLIEGTTTFAGGQLKGYDARLFSPGEEFFAKPRTFDPAPISVRVVQSAD